MNIIIDASNVCWKAYWVSNKSNNVYTNPYKTVETFLGMILSYKKMYKDSTVWMVWDKKLDYIAKNKRKEENELYKSNRIKVDTTGVFEFQEIISELSEYLNIKNFYPYHLEADDCISWISGKTNPNVIFSSDQDMAQLVNENTSFYVLNKKKLITIENFKENYNDLTPQQFVLYKAILGDVSDNIKGINGYGKVKSIKLAKKWYESNVTDEIRILVENNVKIMNLIDNKMLDQEEIQSYNEQYEELLSKNTYNIDIFVDRLKELNIKKHYQNFYEWKDFFE